jgi:hypothetical protein
MRKSKIILALLFSGLLLFFILKPSNVKLRNDLNYINHPTIIDKAAYKLGERKDTSAVKPLLTNILDMRMSTNLNFKGMTVCYCRLTALKKISGVEPLLKLNQFEVDTAAVQFYLDWAVKEKYIKSKSDMNINYKD